MNLTVGKSIAVAALLASGSAWSAVTPCQQIIDKVTAKLEHKGVTQYSLKIVPKDYDTKLRVVGVCEGDKKKVIYKKLHQHKKPETDNETPPAAAASAS